MHAGVKRNDPPKSCMHAKLQLHAFEFPLRPFLEQATSSVLPDLADTVTDCNCYCKLSSVSTINYKYPINISTYQTNFNSSTTRTLVYPMNVSTHQLVISLWAVFHQRLNVDSSSQFQEQLQH